MRYAHRIPTLAVICLALSACDRQVAAPGSLEMPTVQAVPTAEALEPVEEDRELLIGVVGPETGSEAAFGQAVYLGARQAIDHINADGGIDGRQIILANYDNEGDGELTSRAVEHLIGRRALAILTAPTGWATFGPTHIANDSQTILVSIGTRRRIARSGDYIFQLSLNDDIATDQMIEYASREMGYRRYALVSVSDYDYSLDISASFKKALTKHSANLVIELDTYDTFSGQHDVDAVLAGILGSANSLDAIVFAGGIDEAVFIARGLRDQGLGLPILAGEDLYTDDFINKGGVAVTGSLVYASFPDRTKPQSETFIEDYADANGHAPNRFAALAYDAASLIAEAASSSTKSSRVRAALLQASSDGITGITRFTENGAAIKDPVIFKVAGDANDLQFVLQRHSHNAPTSTTP